MDCFSFEFFSPGNSGPCPLVEIAAGIDQDITPVKSDLPILKVCNLNGPLPCRLYPLGMLDLVTALYILSQSVLATEPLKVGFDF